MEYIQRLRNVMKSADIEPFIRHIRFPFFKNLAEGCKVDFNYPITAFVGQNGTNKTPFSERFLVRLTTIRSVAYGFQQM
ncbi:hypothetical protein ACM2MW_005453 [Klebsiella pneumoniae]